MAKMTATHAWDEFWSVGEDLAMHHLGSPQSHTEKQGEWIKAVNELQESGRLSARQILAIAELVRATAARTREYERTTLASLPRRSGSHEYL